VLTSLPKSIAPPDPPGTGRRQSARAAGTDHERNSAVPNDQFGSIGMSDSRYLGSLSALSDRIWQFHVHRSSALFASHFDVPVHFLQLLLIVEDKRFRIHPGIDPISILRAFTSNQLSNGYLQGASTITQQLYDIQKAREDIAFERQRTIRRKLSQAIWSVRKEWRETKADILKEYLSSVHWGRGYYGLDAAAAGYFRSSRSSLSVAESFFLTERLASPNVKLEGRVSTLLARPAVQAVMRADEKAVNEVVEMYDSIPLGAGG
jgi:membrane peptidoglycan carboxypeptidase